MRSTVRYDYLGQIAFSQALEREAAAFARVREAQPDSASAEVFGFETGPVITLGVRAGEDDLIWSKKQIAARGFEIRKLERGGQATLHNPGQLVIFPIVNIRALGARAWVDLLQDVTRETLRGFGKGVRCRKGRPGLFSDHGKVVAVGIRVRDGISTHGLAINVSNELADFAAIRPCGETSAPVDRVGSAAHLPALFAAWSNNFENAVSLGLTSCRNFTSLESTEKLGDVRL